MQENWILDFSPLAYLFFFPAAIGQDAWASNLWKALEAHLLYLLGLLGSVGWVVYYYCAYACCQLCFMGYTANQHKKLQYIGSTETGILVLLARGNSNGST